MEVKWVSALGPFGREGGGGRGMSAYVSIYLRICARVLIYGTYIHVQRIIPCYKVPPGHNGPGLLCPNMTSSLVILLLSVIQ